MSNGVFVALVSQMWGNNESEKLAGVCGYNVEAVSDLFHAWI